MSVARPRQPILSRLRIVEVATAILDREGLDALSTRRLARELGVRAPSLYNHFATKEEILDAVGDAIIAQVDLGMFSGQSGSAPSDAARRPGPAAGQAGSPAAGAARRPRPAG